MGDELENSKAALEQGRGFGWEVMVDAAEGAGCGLICYYVS
jgi:hypothetical protein